MTYYYSDEEEDIDENQIEKEEEFDRMWKDILEIKKELIEDEENEYMFSLIKNLTDGEFFNLIYTDEDVIE